MPAPRDIDLYENPFGHELRRHRHRLEMTQAQLSKRLGYSEDLISKIETGAATPTIEFARDCDTMFATHGAIESLARLVRKGGAFPSWMWEWVEFERKAHTLRNWEPLLIPGLLQTEQYARALLRRRPGATGEQIDEQATARLERQKILEREDPPLLWVMMDEGVLHREVHDADVMRGQLKALIEASQRSNITVQVVRADAPVPGLAGAFAIASFNGTPDVVYLESARAGRVTENPEDVQDIMNIWEAIRTEALPPRASLDLIAQVMEQ